MNENIGFMDHWTIVAEFNTRKHGLKETKNDYKDLIIKECVTLSAMNNFLKQEKQY